MFVDLELARRIEGAEASLTADLADGAIQRASVDGAFRRPLTGGTAAYAGADSPVTKVIGVGLDEVPSAADLDVLEAAYFSRGAAVRAEVATLADPAFVRLLTTRGYVLTGFENVLGLSLRGRSRRVGGSAGAIVIQESRDWRAWVDVMYDGFSAPDTGVISAPGETISREALGPAASA